MSQMTISLCKKHHWPTYDPECPDYEETDAEYNWPRAELKKIEEREKTEKSYFFYLDFSKKYLYYNRNFNKDQLL